MVVTTINIEPYLAEFYIGKYNEGKEEPLQIPDETDLYHLIWQLMAKRPSDACGMETGNLVFFLPDRRKGKDPAYYNWLSKRSASIIEKRIRIEFNNDLHALLEENDSNGRPFDNIDIIYAFMETYGIRSISEDSLKKNYYRWRDNVRKRKKRKYNRQNQ